MRVLFIQHDHVSPVGAIGDRFAAHGFDVEELLVVPEDRFHDPAVSVAFPDPAEYDALVPMGAPWSVYDHATIGAWVLEELVAGRVQNRIRVADDVAEPARVALERMLAARPR